MEPNTDTPDPEEILEHILNNLSECNHLVSALGKKAPFDQEDLRKLRNDLMFARSKARNLAKAYKDMKRPVDSFRLSTFSKK
jgi:hypothetical protein